MGSQTRVGQSLHQCLRMSARQDARPVDHPQKSFVVQSIAESDGPDRTSGPGFFQEERDSCVLPLMGKRVMKPSAAGQTQAAGLERGAKGGFQLRG